jgi:hypothetical protein
MTIKKPESSELNEYYRSYLKYVPEEDLLTTIENLPLESAAFLNGISEEESTLSYDVGKWQVREVLGHLCDTERILSYRALRFARKDETPIPGFEENDYVLNSNFRDRSWASLVEEKHVISNATIHFFRNLEPFMFNLSGPANNNRVSVRAILFFIIAHERHHLQVLKDRYLKR